MRTNCLWYALRKYWRHGGYIVVRRSRHLWVPHFLWLPPGSLDDFPSLRHFVPLSPTAKPWKVWRSLWFEGRVVRSDKDTRPPEH